MKEFLDQVQRRVGGRHAVICNRCAVTYATINLCRAEPGGRCQGQETLERARRSTRSRVFEDEIRGRPGMESPDEPNQRVSCACGCGTKFDKYDESGRPRRYVPGHNEKKSVVGRGWR